MKDPAIFTINGRTFQITAPDLETLKEWLKQQIRIGFINVDILSKPINYMNDLDYLKIIYKLRPNFTEFFRYLDLSSETKQIPTIFEGVPQMSEEYPEAQPNHQEIIPRRFGFGGKYEITLESAGFAPDGLSGGFGGYLKRVEDPNPLDQFFCFSLDKYDCPLQYRFIKSSNPTEALQKVQQIHPGYDEYRMIFALYRTQLEEILKAN